jgi:hypothetical protein
MVKIVPSKDQWKKLKWITKFFIITGYASVLGFILGLLFFIIQVLFFPSVTRKDLESLAKRSDFEDLKSQLVELKEELTKNLSNSDTIEFPGYSINLMASINKNKFNRKAFIFDRGNYLNKERLSLYLNSKNELCYRLIDGAGEVYTLVTDENQGFLKFQKLMFITCEYGENQDDSFQRILINGKEIEKNKFSRNLGLAGKLKIEGSTFGADLEGNNCSMFLAAMHSMAHSTFTIKKIQVFQKDVEDVLNETKFPLMIIDCKSYLRTKSNTNLERIKTGT